MKKQERKMCMIIRGKRGKRENQGYSLKSPRQNGNYYVYVWDKNTYNGVEVAEARKLKKTKNYSKVGGWEYLGRYDDSATWEKLHLHLTNIYGTKINEQEVRAFLEAKYEELEKKRIEKLNQLNKWIAEEYDRMGITDYNLPSDIAKAKKILKELRY